MDGVIVIRTEAAWLGETHPLDLPVAPLQLEDAVAQQALAVACAVLGAASSPVMPERHRFSLTFPGGRLIDFLNAAVRGHGTLSWSFARTPAMPHPWRVSVTLSSGSNGVGCGAPGATAEGVDLGAFISRHAVAKPPADDALARLVAPNSHGGPLMLYGTFDTAVRDLATAVGVPMGLEKVPGPHLIFKEGFAATGSPLHLVLDALVTIDPRYEWRLLDGVVVIRPRTGLGRSRQPLAAQRRQRPAARRADRQAGTAGAACGRDTDAVDRFSRQPAGVGGSATGDRPRPAVRGRARLRRSGVGVRGTGAEDRTHGLRHRMWFCTQAGGSRIPVK